MSTATGQLAEQVAADYLETEGYQILDTNWRTKWCEIDIIARRDQTIYFVEVKYRRSSSAGSGIDYITPQKLRQMSFAAEIWMSQNQEELDYELGAIELSGHPPKVTEFIPQLT